MCHTGWKSHWYKFHCKCGFQVYRHYSWTPSKKNCRFVFVVSVTNGKLWSENIIWEIPEIAIHKCAILGSVMKSHAVLHHSTWDVKYPFFTCILPFGVSYLPMLLLLLLSHLSRVRLCATPEMAAHQASPSLGFSRQEHWSGLPLPSPMHESEKWKGRHSVVSNSSRPHGLQPTRLLRPWDFPGKSTGVGCHCLLLLTHLGYQIGCHDIAVLVFK